MLNRTSSPLRQHRYDPLKRPSPAGKDSNMDAKSWSAVAADHVVQQLFLARLVKKEDIPRGLEVIADEIYHRLSLRDEPQPVVSQADTDETALAREIERTLQGITFVSRLGIQFPASEPGFWPRCRLLTPNWRHARPPQIFVDGYFACCKWNSWRVYTEGREPGLSLWSGYGYAGYWTPHTWCMLGDRFVESGGPFRIYYGAELNETEIDELGNESADLIETSGKKLKLVWTVVDGEREMVRYDRSTHEQSIGRERDLKTGAIKEGLGR